MASKYLGLVLLFLFGCATGPVWAPDWALSDPAQIPVQVEQKDALTRVYLSPAMSPRMGAQSSLLRCYRNIESKNIACQLFIQVRSELPSGERQIAYELGGEERLGEVKLVLEDRACGPLCSGFDCGNSCYNIYFFTYNLDAALVDQLRKMARMPVDLRRPLNFALVGKGPKYQGAIAPTALEALFLKMAEEQTP
ncbi:MAG: hypothetical protein RRB13_15355 [bacterium]|nr:hypothetical protein [bacterium]